MSAGNAVAIVLARAGSKGVPGKNVAMIANKPCIAWTIDYARASASVSTIAVSSDDAKALGVARASGCEIIERPLSLATDTARIDDAARHACEVLFSREKINKSQPIVIFYANVPIRPSGLIDHAVNLLTSTNCDSVQSYQPVGKFHPWWTARVDEHGQVAPWEGDVLNHNIFRRQDLPPAFIPDGAPFSVKCQTQYPVHISSLASIVAASSILPEALSISMPSTTCSSRMQCCVIRQPDVSA
jgi:N-acylneuraminate cytidylyltransferase